MLALAAASASAATIPPSLQVRSLAPFSVRGTHFRPFERVRVTLNRTWTGASVASRTGVVLVTFRQASADRCSGYALAAIGSKGSRTTLRSHPLACSSRNPG
jgi:hypothetical protein